MKPYSDSKAFKLTLLSFIISLFICLIKFLAYLITHSVAIYSDAMESIVNIFSALLAMLGTKMALKPSDAEHPYGHTKIEYFVAILEALFILLASFSIIWKAIKTLLKLEIPEEMTLGSSLLVLALILNGFISWIIYKTGKKEASPILISHATHLFTDVLTTLGVLLGILLAAVFNFWYIDPILALIISINILYMGYKLLKESINSLLDVSICPKKRENIQQIIDSTIQGSSLSKASIHNFKSRRSGRRDFIEFHLTVPKDTTVDEAHNLCDEIEKNIKQDYPEISITIHIEPEKNSD